MHSPALKRFLDAQEPDFVHALNEVTAGRKRGHWMWYIFPQLAGLGRSTTSQFYALSNLAEARAYYEHPVLGSRLRRISQALLELPGHNATAIFSTPDDLKLRSCMTLFAQVPGADPVFTKVLDKYYQGVPDAITLQLLQQQADDA